MGEAFSDIRHIVGISLNYTPQAKAVNDPFLLNEFAVLILAQ